MLNRKFVACFIFAGAALLSACQSSGTRNPGPDLQQSEPPAGAVRESELRAYCPRVTLRDGTAFYDVYEGRAEGDPNKLVYRASISETTRACKYGQGTGSVAVAIAGKIVPGPRGRTGTVTVPIRVVALRGGEVIFSQLYRHPVTIADTAGATQFIFTAPDIAVPGGIDRSVQILAGFDEGPST